jgi:hypothetical protein
MLVSSSFDFQNWNTTPIPQRDFGEITSGKITEHHSRSSIA